MPRYVALLRGVMPTNCKMPELKRAFESARLTLPIEQDGAQIVGIRGGEVFSAYVRSPKGPVFMVLIERAFGKEVTTRTWDTLAKIARQ